MNRLTKQISLVLVSSSLILHGCHREVPEEEKKKKEEEKALAGERATTGTGVRHGYPWGPHFYHFGGRGFSRVGSSTGVRSGTRSGVGSSVRGGFGGMAHGVAS